MSERVFTWTRQLTGVMAWHGYVCRGNKVAVSCKHRHRSNHAAQRCADRMLKQYRTRFPATPESTDHE